MADTVEILFKFVNSGSPELDKAAESAKKLEEGAKKAGAEVEKLEKGFAKTGSASKSFDGLGEKIRGGITDPMGTAGTAAEGLLGKLGRFGAITAAVGAGLGLVSQQLFSLVAIQGAAAEVTLNMADRLGLTAGQMEKLQAQAVIAGVNVGSLEGAARTLSFALEDSGGAGKKAADGLRGLGIATREMNGELRGAGAVLLDTLSALSKIENDSTRVFTALKVLPKGAALELLPLIKNYGDLQRAVESVGVGVEDGLTKKLAEADDAIGRMELAWNRLKRTLAGGISADVVIRVSDYLTGAISGPRAALDGRGSLRDQLTNYGPGQQPPSGDFLGDLRGFAAQANRDSAAKAFRDAQTRTPDGQRARLAELDRAIADLVGALSESIDDSARTVKSAELAKARREKAALEAALRPAADPNAGALRLSDLFAKGGASKPGIAPTLARPLDGLGVFTAAGFNSGEDVGSGGLIPDFFRVTESGVKGDPAAEKAFAAALLENAKQRAELADRRTKIELDAAFRLIELGDNEFNNARAIRDLKLATAKDTVEARQAELDYAARIAEIEKRRRDQAKETAGRVFDSINSREGGFGLGDFVKGQRDIFTRQVFVNGTAGIFEGLGGIGAKIGQSLGPLGKLFEGTFLDPAGAGTPTDKNTSATEKNTTAVERLTATMAAGGGNPLAQLAGIPGLADVVSDGNGITGQGGILSKIPGLGGGKIGGFFDNLFGQKQGSGKGGAAALGLGLGGLQLFQGVRNGDVGSIIGGTLSAAAAIPGPQQPFLQAGALIAGLFGGLFGSSRSKFDREQNDLLNSRKFEAPVSGSRSSEIFGGGDVSTDYDFRGRVRYVVNRPVVVNINALDARSIEERGFDIAEAVRRQVDAGMPITESINRAVFGAGVV